MQELKENKLKKKLICNIQMSEELIGMFLKISENYN